ncbi:MAG TPA: hypothetical protein VF678_06500 [bacterium]
MDGEIVAFFQRYQDEWVSTLSGDRVAEFYTMPCAALRSDGDFVTLETRMEVVAFFQHIIESYLRRGFDSWTQTWVSVQRLGSRAAIATMDWEAWNTEGVSVAAWRQSYNLVRLPDGWRIAITIVHVLEATDDDDDA